jgi:hypothetical protein
MKKERSLKTIMKSQIQKMARTVNIKNIAYMGNHARSKSEFWIERGAVGDNAAICDEGHPRRLNKHEYRWA